MALRDSSSRKLPWPVAFRRSATPCASRRKNAGRVDDHASAVLGLDRESPQHRGRERVGHGALLGVRRVERSERVVGLNQQHLRSHPLELDDGRRAELPAVEADRIRADARRERDLIQELLIEARDLEEQLAFRGVPIQRHVAVDALHRGAPGWRPLSQVLPGPRAARKRPTRRSATLRPSGFGRRRSSWLLENRHYRSVGLWVGWVCGPWVHGSMGHAGLVARRRRLWQAGRSYHAHAQTCLRRPAADRPLVDCAPHRGA